MPNFLVVDDERNVRFLIERFLSDETTKIDTYVSAEEALEAFRKNPGKYDLIITDVKLPGKSGLEMIKEIRKEAVDIPILIISAYVKPEILTELFKFENVDYLSKPFTREELIAKVKSLLEKPKETFDRLLREANENIKKGDLNRAEKSIRQMFKYAPSSPIPHYLMFELLKRRGNEELAQKHLNAAKALDPNKEKVDESEKQ
ncbi:response regulator [Thermosipho atlanticus]|uniref:Response regulator receiver domain-containing protein n=1 Tax=Thermosipho atlanticus DSM 15807 TaxID=1123380 RepID=A0A1M5U6K2_9BACT|nr:response regulator [Thermosipho atlanticus]SHH58672.1 Response regulator receiver domain-containing protein [Thermosipho atlanticus DSM 15807]